MVFAARAATPEVAEWGIERMRLALGVDHDLRDFHDRFRFDPVIGRVVRAAPGLRVLGRPDAFEALAWAISEQLIALEEAAAIQRRLIAGLGRRCATSGLRDSPPAATIARQAPAADEAGLTQDGLAAAIAWRFMQIRMRTPIADADCPALAAFSARVHDGSSSFLP